MPHGLARCLLCLLFIWCPAIGGENHFSAVFGNTTDQNLLVVVHPGGKGSVHAYQADGKRDLETLEDGVYRLPKGSEALLDFVLPLSNTTGSSVDQTISVMNGDRTEYGTYRLNWTAKEKKPHAQVMGTYSQSFVLTDPKASQDASRGGQPDRLILQVEKRKDARKSPHRLSFRLDWDTTLKDLQYACRLSGPNAGNSPETGAISKEGFPILYGNSGWVGKPGGGVKVSYTLAQPGPLLVLIWQAKEKLKIPLDAPIQAFIAMRNEAGRMTLIPFSQATNAQKSAVNLKMEKVFSNLGFQVDASDPDWPVLTVMDR